MDTNFKPLEEMVQKVAYCARCREFVILEDGCFCQLCDKELVPFEEENEE